MISPPKTVLSETLYLTDRRVKKRKKWDIVRLFGDTILNTLTLNENYTFLSIYVLGHVYGCKLSGWTNIYKVHQFWSKWATGKSKESTQLDTPESRDGHCTILLQLGSVQQKSLIINFVYLSQTAIQSWLRFVQHSTDYFFGFLVAHFKNWDVYICK